MTKLVSSIDFRFTSSLFDCIFSPVITLPVPFVEQPWDCGSCWGGD